MPSDPYFLVRCAKSDLKNRVRANPDDDRVPKLRFILRELERLNPQNSQFIDCFVGLVYHALDD